MLFDVEYSKTYIFTFDSLGSRHPQAIKKLSAYLKMEAMDKKGVDHTEAAEGKMVLVWVIVFYSSQRRVEDFTGAVPTKLLRLWDLPSSFCPDLHE